jgi:RNA recognition motif-containing protein
MSLFVGNLPYRLTDAEFTAAFEQFGAVTSVTIAVEVRGGRRLSRGYGFVDFADPASLQACINSGKTITLDDRVVTYREARPQPDISDTAFVAGLTAEATDQSLTGHFARFNPIEAKVVHVASRDRPGFGYAKFASQADRDRAIAGLNGSVLNGASLVVRPASRPFRDDEQQQQWRKSRY